jgi:arsenite methyltransferase
MSGHNMGLAFSKEAAERLIATYSTPDLVRQRDATLQRLNLRPGERVIDIGCGPGFLCKSMTGAIGPTCRVVGIDISRDLIDFAIKDLSVEAIEYRAGNAMALPFDAGQFDVAVSTQVLEYVVDADVALREIARVLRPGGRAFIVDTDFDSWVRSA